MNTCPHCGGVLPGPTAHRGELERQLGDASSAMQLREAAQRIWRRTPNPEPLNGGFIAWRGYVWARCQTRKPAVCVVSGDAIPPGSKAWRQLSEVRDREMRVSDAAWSGVVTGE